MDHRVLLWQRGTQSGIMDGYCRDFRVRRLALFGVVAFVKPSRWITIKGHVQEWHTGDHEDEDWYQDEFESRRRVAIFYTFS